MSLRQRVGERVRLLANEQEIPLTVLAELAGVSRAHLFSFLSGEKDITLGWLERLAEALNVDPSELIGAGEDT